MKKFMVLFMAPSEAMAEWMKKPMEERKEAEDKMRADWNTWMGAHAGVITETAGLGKTKRVTQGKVEDTRNDLMLYSLVQGESADAVAQMFTDHPHFGIPGATIEVMEANVLPH